MPIRIKEDGAFLYLVAEIYTNYFKIKVNDSELYKIPSLKLIKIH